jgi:oxygen-independent coproporphyrinogen-3 oxidase
MVKTMTNEIDSISVARMAFRRFSRKIEGSFFRHEHGKYYSLINYPPLKGMPHQGGDFNFVNETDRSKRLYVHIPFCSSICTLCNYKVLLDSGDRRKYLNYLIRELDLLNQRLGKPLIVDNLFFGGGTPSLLSLDELEYLFQEISERIEIRTQYATFELHPEMSRDADCDAKLDLLRQFGINRVSLGLQAFDEKVLRTINRHHTMYENMSLIDRVDKAGFDYINHDLILGLPHQTQESWLDTVRTSISAKPDSVSPFYCWMKESTPIFQHFLKRPQDFPSLNESFVMTLACLREMKQSGYRLATIDFYYKSLNKEATEESPVLGDFLHTDLDVLALGISGYGFINNVRYMNYLNETEYFASIDRGQLPIFRYDRLPIDDIVRLNLMYSLRYGDVDISSFKRHFDRNIEDDFKLELKIMEDFGLTVRCGDRIHTTLLGKLFSDEICKELASSRVKENVLSVDLANTENALDLEIYSYFYNVENIQ